MTESDRLWASDGASGDLFGSAIAMRGDLALIGSAADDNERGLDAGAAYVFDLAPITGDIDCDGVVGMLDLAILLVAWGDCPITDTCAADLDNSGTVNVTDLLQLLAAWGSGL
jgi:hypothetical protein